MMKKNSVFAFALLLVVPAALMAQDAMRVLNDAARVMGLENLRTLQYTASGSTFGIGQSFTAGGPYPRFTIKKFVRDFDLDSFTIRQEFVTTRTDLRGGALPIRVGAEQTQVQYLNSNSPWPAHVFMWLNPPGFVKGAMKNNPTLTTETVSGKKYNVVTVKLQNKYTVRGYFNEQNLLDKVETALDNHIVLGDAPLDGIFSDYKDFNGIKFPAHILHNMGLQPSFDFFINEVKPNVAVNTQPPQAQGGGGGQGQGVQSQKVVEGVYYFTGGTHHSIAVEFDGYIVVIEAPQSEARSLAVIAEVKKQIPNKPIRYLINTHHHFDHSNGLRTYVDEGATIVTHPLNRNYYEKWWARERTLFVDRLAQSKKKATFEIVNDRKVLTGGARMMEIHLVRGTTHAEGMLMVYLPKEKILVEADIYTPPAPNAPPAQGPPDDGPMALNLVENIERLKLDVQQILPLHGPGAAPKTDLYRAAGRPGSAK
jgi:glyoxylase-like metal-dependent hydrolase (beta-lactamase superfamily II)